MLELLIILLFSKTIIAQPCKEIVGYYPNWQWYDRNKLVCPNTIDYSKYTILNYCFFKVLPNGNIQITDAWADKNLLLGPINWAVAPVGYDTQMDFGNVAYHQPNNRFSDICHQHGVKLLPSIGGWTLSNEFPAIAADPIKRHTFAQSCVTLIQAFGFDGIDIDWEYPGYSEHGGTSNDKINYTLFLQEIRTAIDAYGTSVGKEMLLTIAVGASPSHMSNVEWGGVAPIVDIVNLMSYDFFGAFDPITNHNAPLFAPLQGDPTFNLAKAVESLTQTYQVSPSKITAGVPFYGRSMKTASIPILFGGTTGSTDNVTFSLDDGNPLYYNILGSMNQFDDHWDNVAKVPFLTGKNDLKTFVSYDNVESITQKAQFIVDQNLRGAIIWEITGDYIETSSNSGVIQNTPLVNALNNVFCNQPQSITSEKEMVEIYISPNPVKNQMVIDNFKNEFETFEVFDSKGQIVIRKQQLPFGKVNVFLPDLMDGIYYVFFKSNANQIVKKIIVLN